ncbi:hypothetical protein V6Z11_A11G153800 [Gossypium hirsutum]
MKTESQKIASQKEPPINMTLSEIEITKETNDLSFKNAVVIAPFTVRQFKSSNLVQFSPRVGLRKHLILRCPTMSHSLRFLPPKSLYIAKYFQTLLSIWPLSFAGC